VKVVVGAFDPKARTNVQRGWNAIKYPQPPPFERHARVVKSSRKTWVDNPDRTQVEKQQTTISNPHPPDQQKERCSGGKKDSDEPVGEGLSPVSPSQADDSTLT